MVKVVKLVDSISLDDIHSEDMWLSCIRHSVRLY